MREIARLAGMSRFQFSLRMLLVAVAVVGIGAALWRAEASWQAGAIEFLLVAWVVATVAMMSVNAKGRAKAFWMGVTTECVWPVLGYLPVVGFFSLNGVIESGHPVPPFLDTLDWFPLFLIGMSDSFRPVLLAWAFAPVIGLLCIFTHWLLARPPG